jgi:hypothetical protein
MKNFKKLIIYISIFFGMFFVIMLILGFIFNQDLIHSKSAFMYYSLFLGWWIPIPTIKEDEF